MFQDLISALRSLVKSPGFTLAAALSIALAIGANTALFSLQDGILLRPLAVERPAEVVTVRSSSAVNTSRSLSYPDYVEVRDNNRSFDGVVAYRLMYAGFSRNKNITPEFKIGLLVSGNFFDVLGVKPALGRGFHAEEDKVPGRDAVVVLSHGFWKDEFASDPAVVGSRIHLGPELTEFTVLGVTPASYQGMDLFLRPNYFVPVMMGPKLLERADFLSERKAQELEADAIDFVLKARLKSGVSIAAANDDVSALQ